MPSLNARGVEFQYEIHGDKGPWVALSPGGRRGLEAVQSLAQRIAASGYRVMIHDRRNCGLSDIVIEGKQSEYEIWADDLYAILTQLNALPAYVGGSSSGCRLSLLFTLRHPASVLGLLLWRVTGGAFAAKRLAENYYGKYIAAAKQGGMAAVCEVEHFAERIAARPENRARLMSMDTERFIEVMTNWRDYFVQSIDTPVIGASEAELRSIKVPACIIPGNDNTHPRTVGENLYRLLPGSELHILFPEHVDVDLVPAEEWQPKEPEMASILTGFLDRARARAAA